MKHLETISTHGNLRFQCDSQRKPRTTGAQNSILELRVLAEFEHIFGKAEKLKNGNIEIDVFIPGLKIGVEIDSYHRHNAVDNPQKTRINQNKSNYCNANNIFLLRVREKMEPLSPQDISFPKKWREKDYYPLVKQILTRLQEYCIFSLTFTKRIKTYLRSQQWANDERFRQLLAERNRPPFEDSLAANNTLSLEWDYKKNYPLTPEDVTKSSSKRASWKCVAEHEWDATVADRTRGRGCPYCRGSKPSATNNLLVKYQHIAAQLHPTKNASIDPMQILATSHKKLWWQCDLKHEWESTVANRVAGNSCPDCMKTRPSPDYNLAVLYPEIAKEFHPTKNGDLLPTQVTHSSRAKVYWLCPKGHTYLAAIYNRTGNNSGCPDCDGRKPTVTKNFAILHPEIAKEFHPTKNGDLKSNQLMPSSNKKVWWLCQFGHEWDAVVANRTRHKSGCPHCAGQKITPDNCLANMFPQIALYWHPTKNGTLTPQDFTSRSKQIVWWVCDNLHSFEEKICNRSRRASSGCPKCK